MPGISESVGAGWYTDGMSPLTIEVPELAISADQEQPIGGPDRYRVFIGPEIELVMTSVTAERLADALVDALSLNPLTPGRRPGRTSSW